MNRVNFKFWIYLTLFVLKDKPKDHSRHDRGSLIHNFELILGL